MTKHKLTPEQEAQLVIALTCLTKAKEIELKISNVNIALMDHFINGTPFDRVVNADMVHAAIGQLDKMKDQLVMYANVVDDRRTKSQVNYRNTQIRLHGDCTDRYLEARYRDPKAMIANMAETIAKRRSEEDGTSD